MFVILLTRNEIIMCIRLNCDDTDHILIIRIDNRYGDWGALPVRLAFPDFSSVDAIEPVGL
jgi:hypothetical protein